MNTFEELLWDSSSAVTAVMTWKQDFNMWFRLTILNDGSIVTPVNTPNHQYNYGLCCTTGLNEAHWVSLLPLSDGGLSLPHLVVGFQVFDEIFYRLQPDLLIRFGQIPEEVEKDTVLLEDASRPDRLRCLDRELHHLCSHALTQPRLLYMLQEKNVPCWAATISGLLLPLFLNPAILQALRG